VLKPASEKDAEFPPVSIVLGTHNLQTVQQAQALHSSPRAAGVELAIAQLMGMADEVSCTLIAGGQDATTSKSTNKSSSGTTTMAKSTAGRVGIDASQDTKAKAYKYIVWGTTKECMTYLLRRAHENKDAVSRTKAGRDAMWEETKRRFWSMFSSSA